MDRPEKQSLILPSKRVEVEYLAETYTRASGRVAQFKTPTQQITRKQLYKCDLVVRMTVQSDDENWLAGFVKDFLINLPSKIADQDDNLVTVRANKAIRSGFESKTVEVFKKRSNALHIIFTGMICRDETQPLIREIDLRGITLNY